LSLGYICTTLESISLYIPSSLALLICTSLLKPLLFLSLTTFFFQLFLNEQTFGSFFFRYNYFELTLLSLYALHSITRGLPLVSFLCVCMRMVRALLIAAYTVLAEQRRQRPIFVRDQPRLCCPAYAAEFDKTCVLSISYSFSLEHFLQACPRVTTLTGCRQRTITAPTTSWSR
jgi:hypothetical protein